MSLLLRLICFVWQMVATPFKHRDQIDPHLLIFRTNNPSICSGVEPPNPQTPRPLAAKLVTAVRRPFQAFATVSFMISPDQGDWSVRFFEKFWRVISETPRNLLSEHMEPSGIDDQLSRKELPVLRPLAFDPTSPYPMRSHFPCVFPRVWVSQPPSNVAGAPGASSQWL